MVSAHRFGAGRRAELENTREALDRVLVLAVEYVEFDVQRCADGTLVLCHDDTVDIDGVTWPIASISAAELAAAGDRYLHYDDVLRILAAAGKKAHIDLKLTSAADAYREPDLTVEVDAVRRAVAVLGIGNLIVTTNEDRSVRAVRSWADRNDVSLLVGLSLGRSRSGLGWRAGLAQLLSELLPGGRYRRSGANLVVAHRHLARLTVARWARRQRLPLLVWTVDRDRELRYWLRPGRAWLVTTNEPATALRLRAEIRASRPART